MTRKVIQFRVNDDEDARLRRAAENAGLSLTAFVLKAALAEADATTEPNGEMPADAAELPEEVIEVTPVPIKPSRKAAQASQSANPNVFAVGERCALCRKTARMGGEVPDKRDCAGCRAMAKGEAE